MYINCKIFAIVFVVLVVCSQISHAGSDRLRFFVHIPKTGGTTFRHIFAADCTHTWTFLAKSPGNINDFPLVKTLVMQHNHTCFQGHMAWDLVAMTRRYFYNHTIESFVLLREPNARLLSSYYYDQMVFNQTFVVDDYFSDHANAIALYLGNGDMETAKNVLLYETTHVGITEYYHETLAYLLAVGFLENYETVVNYRTRKVRPRNDFDPLLKTAILFNAEDSDLYSIGLSIFFERQLEQFSNETTYKNAIAALNNNTHTCKNDEIGIGSGKCW